MLDRHPVVMAAAQPADRCAWINLRRDIDEGFLVMIKIPFLSWFIRGLTLFAAQGR